MYIVNVQIHRRVCTPYIASCLEQQLVCIAVPMKVHTLYTLEMKLCTLKIIGNTAIQSANQKCQFSFSTREKDFIFSRPLKMPRGQSRTCLCPEEMNRCVVMLEYGVSLRRVAGILNGSFSVIFRMWNRHLTHGNSSH